MTDRLLSREPSFVPVTAVFGADGFIGSNLLDGLLSVNRRCLGVGRRIVADRCSLDLLNPEIGPLDLRRRGVSHAVIAAGIGTLAQCEREPARTRRVNVTGILELARQLREEGIRVVALSSDYVFDGESGKYDEASPVGPLNEYGRQKVDLENGLLHDVGGDPLVIRLSKVFSLCRGSATLLDEIAGQLSRGETVRAARDQYFCPTLVDDLVTGVARLLATGGSGIVHLCAPTRISRLQLAGKVAAAFGCASELVEDISLRDLDEGFARPLDTSMICTRLDCMPPHHFTGLDVCIARLRGNYGPCEAVRR